MFELRSSTDAPHVQPAYLPDREADHRNITSTKTEACWSTELLDHLDFGVIVVRRDLTVAHANRTACRRLRLADETTSLRHSPLWDQGSAAARQFTQAVNLAVDRSLRSTISWQTADDCIALAVVPLGQRDAEAQPLAMVLMERERLCTPLALAGFGRLLGLTGAQLSIVEELCAGHEPAEIATRQGVAITTVRTHVGALRSKMGVTTVRELLIRLACLPPMMDILRGGQR
jgi:DNA-binding CsgD family transcriptional regulator